MKDTSAWVSTDSGRLPDVGRIDRPEPCGLDLDAEVAQRERERIARDLHDGFGQTLTGAQLLLCITLTKLEPGSPAAQSLAEATAAVQRALVDLRALAYGLAPVELAHGLGPALSGLAVQMTVPGGPVVRFAGDATLALPGMLAEQFYRITQEAVTNAVRHAASRQIVISLERQRDAVALRIADDGRGFDTGAPRAGIGLRSMRHRAKTVDGDFSIVSGPGVGTVITCSATA